MSIFWSALLLAVVTALACAVPGAFIVLRRNSMLVDAISHAILPGIVLGYFFTRDLNSPWLILGAALTGLLVVLVSEFLNRSGLVTTDSSQGLFFPALFSIGVILVSLNFQNIHLDTHAVLVGDLNLAVLDQAEIFGVRIGPSYFYLMLAVLLLNLIFIAIFYRQLKITTFDPEFAKTIGINSTAVNTAFMFLVSFTITAAFNAAGAILVIALTVVPAAAAYLLVKELKAMLYLTAVFAVLAAVLGFGLSYILDAPTSAGMAVFNGLLFLVVFVVSLVLRSRAQAKAALVQ